MKYPVLFSLIFFSQHNAPVVSATSPTIKTDSGKIVVARVFPNKPFIEQDQYGQYLNFDITLKNTSIRQLDLSAIEVSIRDAKGNLLLRKSLNSNGQAPSIGLAGNRIIHPGETINIFNPFFSFSNNIPLSRLTYDFWFNYSDSKQEKENNKTRLPIDYDASIKIRISPTLYIQKTRLYLPLKGKLLVWDGHDFYSHHRRFPIGLQGKLADGITANSNRYAYDFITIDNAGNMYKTSPFKKENWYVFGKPVYSPGLGRIIESRNDIPDNEFSGHTIMPANIPDTLDPFGMGNHVIIDHGNGEYSVILHMEKGSLRSKTGDIVHAGQQIGNVGFSGDAIYPHVHYTVINGPKLLVSEGIPSYFHQYKLFTGRQVQHINRGRVDSGNVIESEN